MFVNVYFDHLVTWPKSQVVVVSNIYCENSWGAILVMNSKKNALFQCKKRESKTAIMQIESTQVMFVATSGK